MVSGDECGGGRSYERCGVGEGKGAQHRERGWDKLNSVQNGGGTNSTDCRRVVEEKTLLRLGWCSTTK